MRVEGAATPVPLFPRQVLAIVIFPAPSLCNEKSLPRLHLFRPPSVLAQGFGQAGLARPGTISLKSIFGVPYCARYVHPSTAQ